MELPVMLQAALAEELETVPQEEVLWAAGEVSRRYRIRGGEGFQIRSRAEALAYALARMPATYGAVWKALRESLEGMGGLMQAPLSLLDVGAGTGAAAWAAAGLAELGDVTCLETADEMRRLGESLMRREGSPLRQGEWGRLDLVSEPIARRADLVIASYVVNEIGEENRERVLAKLWEAAGKLLLLVEPGTPEGFRLLKEARSQLLNSGAHVLAPCPQEGPCPLPDGDWCHFTCRVQRTRLHKLAKGGDAPFEDEKFSYLALSREPGSPCGARILRHPYIGKGHVRLELCSSTGLKRQTVAKRDGALYKAAKKAGWGDRLDGVS